MNKNNELEKSLLMNAAKNKLFSLACGAEDKCWLMGNGINVPVRIVTITDSSDADVNTTFECELRFDAPSYTSVNKVAYNTMFRKPNATAEIVDVIFNPPATIVKWSDGTKTVVKCGEHDVYDPEKGLAMAIVKKTMGNQGNYNNLFKKWCGPWWEQEDKYAKFLADFYNNVMDGLVNRDDIEKVSEEEPKSRWMIYYRNVETGTPEDFYDYAYSSKYSAERAARRMFGDPAMGAYTWRVAEV